jgi:hypothetical protein
MMVFDREGNFLRSWGEGVFPRAHGAHFAPDETLYLTDDDDHTVRRCTLDGKVLMTLGIPGRPAPFMSQEPFHRCTHTAPPPHRDPHHPHGYGNARVHQLSPHGKLHLPWGVPGSAPGEYHLHHYLFSAADVRFYVADRESHRIQVFDGNCKYETEWRHLHRPSGIFMPPGKCSVCYVGECGPTYGFSRDAPNLGPRVSIVDNQGKLLARFGDIRGAGTGPGQFISPHGLAVDSHGDVYVGEVSATAWPQLKPDVPPPSPLHSLRKMKRI